MVSIYQISCLRIIMSISHELILQRMSNLNASSSKQDKVSFNSFEVKSWVKQLRSYRKFPLPSVQQQDGKKDVIFAVLKVSFLMLPLLHVWWKITMLNICFVCFRIFPQRRTYRSVMGTTYTLCLYIKHWKTGKCNQAKPRWIYY